MSTQAVAIKKVNNDWNWPAFSQGTTYNSCVDIIMSKNLNYLTVKRNYTNKTTNRN